MYAFANLALASSFEMPGLATVADANRTVRIERGTPVAQADRDYAFTEVLSSDASAWQKLAPIDGGFVLRFRDCADFLVTDTRVDVRPAVGSDWSTNLHLLLDHVLPRYLAWTGDLALHASAVELADGRLLVFAGESGAGKSTLAAAFASLGLGRVVADDCVVLEVRDDLLVGLPSYACSRLWPDSLDALHPDGAESSAMATYSAKRIVVPRAPETPRAAPVAAVFALERWDETTEPWLGDMRPDEACAALVAHAFRGLRDATRGLRVVARASTLARKVPVRPFDYVRRYDALEAAADAILRSLPGPSSPHPSHA